MTKGLQVNHHVIFVTTHTGDPVKIFISEAELHDYVTDVYTWDEFYKLFRVVRIPVGSMLLASS